MSDLTPTVRSLPGVLARCGLPRRHRERVDCQPRNPPKSGPTRVGRARRDAVNVAGNMTDVMLGDEPVMWSDEGL